MLLILRHDKNRVEATSRRNVAEHLAYCNILHRVQEVNDDAQAFETTLYVLRVFSDMEIEGL